MFCQNASASGGKFCQGSTVVVSKTIGIGVLYHQPPCRRKEGAALRGGHAGYQYSLGGTAYTKQGAYMRGLGANAFAVLYVLYG